MLIVLIFLVITMSSLLLWYYVVLPLSSFNTASVSQINTNISSISSANIGSDFDNNQQYSNKNSNWTNVWMDWTQNNIKLNSDIVLTDEQKNKIWLLSQISKTDIKTNNLINNKLINTNKFWLELQLIPLSDINSFSFYTTDTVNNVIVKMFVYKIDSDIKTIKWTLNNISIDNSNTIWLISNIWNQSWINWNVVNSNQISSDKFVSVKDLLWTSKFYYKDKGLTFNKKVTIKPFYNINNITWQLKINDYLFHPKYLYFIKLYLNLDKAKIDNFKLYIPNGSYITLNNIEKIQKIKQGKKYYINKVKIIKNWLINKINKSEYWF